MGGIGSGRSPHLGAANKCEHWRSIDLADLKRMGLLKPIVGDRWSRHRAPRVIAMQQLPERSVRDHLIL